MRGMPARGKELDSVQVHVSVQDDRSPGGHHCPLPPTLGPDTLGWPPDPADKS